MRHRKRGRKLGRNHSHRKAMFRNMACSLIRSVRVYEDDEGRPEPGSPKIAGRIVTTVAKAKELRPMVEKLITMARKAKQIEEKAQRYGTDAAKNTEARKEWRESNQWNDWAQAIAPAVAMRRRAFATLRDHEAVDVLFDELAVRFEDRAGGYTRVVRLAERRLGDSGEQAMIEFVGVNDRVTTRKSMAPVVTDEEEETTAPEAAESDDEAEPTAESEADAEQEAESEPVAEADGDAEAADATEDEEKPAEG